MHKSGFRRQDEDVFTYFELQATKKLVCDRLMPIAILNPVPTFQDRDRLSPVPMLWDTKSFKYSPD